MDKEINVNKKFASFTMNIEGDISKVKGDIARLKLEPTDVIVLKVQRPMDSETLEIVSDTFRRIFDNLGIQNRILTLDNTIDMEIIDTYKTNIKKSKKMKRKLILLDKEG